MSEGWQAASLGTFARSMCCARGGFHAQRVCRSPYYCQHRGRIGSANPWSRPEQGRPEQNRPDGYPREDGKAPSPRAPEFGREAADGKAASAAVNDVSRVAATACAGMIDRWSLVVTHDPDEPSRCSGAGMCIVTPRGISTPAQLPVSGITALAPNLGHDAKPYREPLHPFRIMRSMPQACAPRRERIHATNQSLTRSPAPAASGYSVA